MSRLRIAFVLAVAAAVALGVVVAAPSDASGRIRRSTPGLIQSFTNEDVQFTAFNPTTRARTVTIALTEPFGFPGASSQTFTVSPGLSATKSFSCTGALGCASIPIATGDKRMVWTANFYPMSKSMTPDQQTLGPTQWKFI